MRNIRLILLLIALMPAAGCARKYIPPTTVKIPPNCHERLMATWRVHGRMKWSYKSNTFRWVEDRGRADWVDGRYVSTLHGKRLYVPGHWQ